MTKVVIGSELETRIADACRSGVKSCREIARDFAIAPSTVSNILRRQGLAIPTGRRPTCALDHTAFDVASDEADYWTGFLCADGTIGDYGAGAPSVILELAERDRGHVEKFRAFLKSTHTISTIQHKRGFAAQGAPDGIGRSAAFRVRSTQLVEALRARGLAKASPDRAPNPRLADSCAFWRGMVDGDGTVRWATDRKKSIYPSIILCGHMPVLECFQAFLARRGLNANITDTASGIFQIRLMGSGATAIVKFLYGGHPKVALERKFKIALEILQKHG